MKKARAPCSFHYGTMNQTAHTHGEEEWSGDAYGITTYRINQLAIQPGKIKQSEAKNANLKYEELFGHLPTKGRTRKIQPNKQTKNGWVGG